MTDILQGAEMPDLEARIVKEVIEEEADVLDDSLDSHWLQDDVSIDTDFRLDFSFSPFSTPRSVNNDRWQTPTKISNQTEYDKNGINFVTSSKDIKLCNKYYMDNIKFESENKTNHVENMYIAKEMQIILESKDNHVIDKIENNDINNIDFHTKDGALYNKNFDINHVFVSGKHPQNFYVEKDNLGANDSNIFNVKIADNNCGIIEELNDQQCVIDRNLKVALKDENNKEFSLDDLIRSPAGMSATSSPIITNIIFGNKQNVDEQNSNSANKILDIGKENKNIDSLEEFFKDKDEDIKFNIIKRDEKENESDKFPKVEKLEGKKKQAKKKKKKDVIPEKNNSAIVDRLCNLSSCYCKLCKKKYKGLKNLKEHVMRKHGIHIDKSHEKKLKPYKSKSMICDICGNVFTSRKSFETHIESHMNGMYQDKYQCKHCKLTFSTLSRLKIHITSHTLEVVTNDQKNYECDVCGAKFNHIYNFKIHKRRHAENYIVSCRECARSFYRISDLTTHLRTHSGELPYECTICNKKFSRSDSLARHIKAHYDEKIHECQYCDARFVSRPRLKSHQRTAKKCLIKQRELNNGIVEESDDKFELIEELDEELMNEETNIIASYVTN